MRIKNWRKFQHYKHRDPPWIRLYRGLLNDREWHNLDGEAAKALVNIWLLASETDGVLPPVPDLAFRLRMEEKQVSAVVSRLSHWLEHDASTMLADCYRNATPETETETETEKKDAPDGATSEGSVGSPLEPNREAQPSGEAESVPPAKKYHFESGCIRLSRRDFLKWEEAYTNLDLRAELLSLTQWAAHQKDWFFAVAGALSKRNREERRRRDIARAGGPGLPLTPQGNPWPEGIV